MSGHRDCLPHPLTSTPNPHRLPGSVEELRGETMPDTDLPAATMRRVSTRLLPLLMLAYLVCYIDRVNAGFAALQMNKDVGLTAALFGLGGGIFFAGYFLFEVPSNLALERFGASKWICRIMISWGIVSGCMALTSGPNSFIALRFILGAAEAGFFPGVILYLTYWFPAEQRGRIVGIFMVAIPAAGFIGSPISGLLLGLHGFGLHGWQWLFIIEAIPSIILGVACLAWLTDKPAHAKWLTAEQKTWLSATLDAERRAAKRVEHVAVWKVISNPAVLALSIIYAGSATASSILQLWQPQFLKTFGLTNSQVGWVNAVPYAISMIGMIWWGWRSDRKAERVWHTAIPLTIAGVSLALCVAFPALWPTMVLLCICQLTYAVARGPFWALASENLSAGSAAAGIAMINSVGTGFAFGVNPMVGIIYDSTHSYPLALTPVVVFLIVAAVVVVVMGAPKRVHATA